MMLLVVPMTLNLMFALTAVRRPPTGLPDVAFAANEDTDRKSLIEISSVAIVSLNSSKSWLNR